MEQIRAILFDADGVVLRTNNIPDFSIIRKIRQWP